MVAIFLIFLIYTYLIVYFTKCLLSKFNKSEENFKLQSSFDYNITLSEEVFTKIYEFEDLKLLNYIPLPVGVLEITFDKRKLQHHWCNLAAIKFWKKKSLKEYLEMDFSEASEQTLNSYKLAYDYFMKGNKDVYYFAQTYLSSRWCRKLFISLYVTISLKKW